VRVKLQERHPPAPPGAKPMATGKFIITLYYIDTYVYVNIIYI
jgi:hypothetical protein